MRDILPLLKVKHLKQPERMMSLWLIYLMKIDADGNAPTDFRSIRRHLHVHDLDRQNTGAFWDFLNAMPRDTRDQGNRAISTMRKAFFKAAQKDRFLEATNPFDTKLDRIGKLKKKGNQTKINSSQESKSKEAQRSGASAGIITGMRSCTPRYVGAASH